MFYLILLILPILGLIRITHRPKKLKHKSKWIAVIPAHNEENTIEKIIYDCKQNHFDEIIVLLDACTDNTKTIVQYEKVDYFVLNFHSKTKSLRYALPRIADELNDNDVIFIFDADNRLPQDFYKNLIDFPAVQVRVKNKNYTNVVSNYYAFIMSYAERLQVLLNNFHLSGVFAGTGYYLKASIVKYHRFDVKSLLDDMEYSALIPEKIYYDDKNFVYNEQPTSFKVSIKQLLRWLRGGYQILFTRFYKVRLNKLHILFFPLLNLYSIISIAIYPMLFIQSFYLGNILTGLIFTIAYFSIIIYKSDIPKITPLDFVYLFTINYFLIFLNIYALFTFTNHKWVRTPHYIKSID